MVVIPVSIFKLGEQVVVSERLFHKFSAESARHRGFLDDFLDLRKRVLRVIKVRRLPDSVCLRCGPVVDYLGHQANCELFGAHPPHPQMLVVGWNGGEYRWPAGSVDREISGYWFDHFLPDYRAEFRRWRCFVGRWLVGFINAWGSD